MRSKYSPAKRTGDGGEYLPATRPPRPLLAGKPRLTVVRSSAVVAASPEDAFRFLADPAHAELLSPPPLAMRNMSAEGAGLGADLEYVFRWAGIPLYMRLKVDRFEPPQRIVLVQTLGPWRHYRQIYTLSRVAAGTRIEETIEFIRRPGWIEWVLDRFSIQPYLREVAAYRQRALLKHLGAHA